MMSAWIKNAFTSSFENLRDKCFMGIYWELSIKCHSCMIHGIFKRIIPIEFGNNCHSMNALNLWRKLPDPVMGGYYKLPSDFTWEQLVGVDWTWLVQSQANGGKIYIAQVWCWYGWIQFNWPQSLVQLIVRQQMWRLKKHFKVKHENKIHDARTDVHFSFRG